MKKIHLILRLTGSFVGLAAIVLAPMTVAAATTNTTTTNTTAPASTSQTTTSTNSTNPANSTANTITTTKSEEMQEYEKLVEGVKKTPQADRLKSRLAELKVKLTDVETAKYKAKCMAAQNTVRTTEKQVDGGVTSRIGAYNELLKHLDDLTAKIKAGGKDTTELSKERGILAEKISLFKTDLAKYKVALNDLGALGCQADPTAFKATLESARAARLAVAKDAADIRTYVNGPIKTTLKDLRTKIDPESSAANSSTTTNTTTNPSTNSGTNSTNSTTQNGNNSTTKTGTN